MSSKVIWRGRRAYAEWNSAPPTWTVQVVAGPRTSHKNRKAAIAAAKRREAALDLAELRELERSEAVNLARLGGDLEAF